MFTQKINIKNKRTFVLGSEWLYLKLYSGPKTLEHIFVNEIYSKIKELLEIHLIDYFFFIRYTDPDYHIRLRLHLKDINNIGKVVLFLNQILEDYIINHIIKKTIIDVYNREIERYSQKYITDIEKVFYYDSAFILDYLAQCKEDDKDRWLVSIKCIDCFLNKCGFTITNKMEFCEKMWSSYSKEIYSDAPFVNKQLSKKFKNNKREIVSIVDNDNEQQYNWIRNLTHYLNQITFFTQKVKLEKHSDIFPLLNSIIHMHVNRMFRTKQRLNECVIYYLLLKYYKLKNETK